MENNEEEFQQLLQIREEIHQELEKIPPLVLQLQEITNRFVKELKVLESLSQNTQDQLKATIKNASFEMAELATEELSRKIEDQIQSILGILDKSVREAKVNFESVSKRNIWKTVTTITLLVLLSLSLGFCIGGYYYEKRSYSLSKEFLKMNK